MNDPYGTYAGIPPGGTGANTGDPYGISAPPDCIPGQLAHLELLLTLAGGQRDTVRFALTVGEAQESDPTGPDGYGYFAYDQSDAGYPRAPVYEWVDIAYPENEVGLTDFGTDQDDSRTLMLPFAFTFYGQSFDRVTICSNGWLSFGQTYLVNERNWWMPSSVGPANMVAGFWDDLYQSGAGLVYHWYDAAAQRYVVSWDNVRRRIGWFNTYPESFQIILYDPAWYETPTGDGEIVLQFETVNNLDWEQMYCTVGIQNEDHTSGLTFNYFNLRPATAAALESGLAVRFTTGEAQLSRADPTPGLGPTKLMLSGWPSPFRLHTQIRFELPRRSHVRLGVHGVDGRRVRLLHEGALDAGRHTLVWDGTDGNGRALPGGVYYCRVAAEGQQSVRRVLLLR